MLIARQKRKENIAEYLLYMFQVEDLIRAFDFNIDLIEQHIINQFDQPYPVKRDMREWYLSHIRIMQSKELQVKGHIPAIQSFIKDLELLHTSLLRKAGEQKYKDTFSKLHLYIITLREKSDNKIAGDIELCLNGLYGLLMLRLTKKPINPETAEAFGLISELIAILSSEFLRKEEINN